MHQMMFCLPLYYGIWRPYKYCAILVCRKCYPLLTCLVRSDLKIGDELLANRKLLYLERLYGAFFPAGNERGD